MEATIVNLEGDAVTPIVPTTLEGEGGMSCPFN